MIDEIKEKLKLSIEHSYSIVKSDTVITTMNDNEFKDFEACYEFATKEELLDLLKVYHKEVKRVKMDIKEIIEE